MKDIDSRSEFADYLKFAIDQTNALITLHPKLSVYAVIRSQLLQIKSIVIDERRLPTFNEKEAIPVGNVALKNLKEENPDYTDLIMELGYKFYYYEDLPI